MTTEQRARFVASAVMSPNGCWDWHGQHDSDGYGRFTVNDPEQETTGAHRFAYLWFVGDVEPGLHLDHICRNVGCCNPLHVEPVTPAENLRRADVALGIRSAATHCVNGHEFTPENTARRTSGRRTCRQCKREYDRRVYPARYAEVKRRRALVTEGV